MSQADAIVRAYMVWPYGLADSLVRARVWGGVCGTAGGHVWALMGWI